MQANENLAIITSYSLIKRGQWRSRKYDAVVVAGSFDGKVVELVRNSDGKSCVFTKRPSGIWVEKGKQANSPDHWEAHHSLNRLNDVPVPKKAKAKYEEFHGHQVRKTSKLRVNVPDTLILLGRATQIGYVSDKLNGTPHPDGGETEFLHFHHKSTMLYTDETGTQLYIIGPNLKVDKAGVHN
jgi:hypothetical protein